MQLYIVLTVLGFGFGTALTLILLSLSLKKTPKRYDDYAFGVVLLCCAIWNAANLLSLLAELLFGSVAYPAMVLFKLFALVGLALMPSALLHVYLAIVFRNTSAQPLRLSLRQRLRIAAAYLPALFFLLSPIKWPLLPIPDLLLSRLFVVWGIAAICLSLWISHRFIPHLPDPSDRHFYRDLNQLLAGIAIGLLLVFLLPLFRLPYIGRYFILLMWLSPAYPMAVLAYYVYRYNFYRLVVKPSLVYSIVYGLVLALYLLGIRRLGDYLGQFPDINSALIEALLLVALVFAFQPFRTRLQNRLDKLFFKERYYYQQVLRELSDSISRIVDLDRLLATLSDALLTVFKAKANAILVFRFDSDRLTILRTAGTATLVQIEPLVQALQNTRHFRLRRQMRDHRVVWALQQNNIALAVPISFEQELTGLIGLGERQNGNEYTDEEMDVLQTFANQVGLAFEYARLVQERLEMESRIYQTENLRNMGQLAATIAHEIKNPLSSIKVLVQVLSESADPEQAADLHRVVAEINRLNEVLEKLLSFARPSQSNAEQIDVREIAMDITSLLRHQAEQSGVHIEVISPDQPCRVLATQQAVREILFNLLLNAVQASPKGAQVTVQIGVVQPQAGKRKESRLEIRVRDKGAGIDPELTQKIFAPFFTTKAVGAGLGLTIVRRNVADLGGEIKIHSRKGWGTEFTIDLKCNEQSQEQAE
ncbi:MAG TPA: ATP-binding protein [bacterium]|nr:ATP-binding protein [bacterium]